MSRATTSRTRLPRLLRRPARAVGRPVEALQAADDVERLLEGRREEPADAARLRHGVPDATPSSRRTCTRLEEAKKRDHRKLGKELGLFTFHPWAPGAAFWLAKGTTLYNTLADYMRDVLLPAGYVEVKAPIVFNKALWETSGHWQHYRENMFLVESEGEQMGLKAMNCPGHLLVFGSEVRSYRDLPLRFHEQTPLHRNEASGVLSGLTRVRQFTQDDAHCFVMESQIGDEVERAAAARAARLPRLRPGATTMKLSTRPREFLGEVATWDHAEARAEARARGGRRRPTRSTPATARSTGRRSTSTSPTRSAASGSAPRSSSTTRCRSAST